MQPEQPAEQDEPKPAPKKPEGLKRAAKEQDGSKSRPKLNEGPDVHRVFWERTRFSRTIEVLLVQGLLWVELFGFSRGAFAGVRFVIPFVIYVAVLTYVLMSVTRSGSTLDIAIALFHAFSSLLLVFSALYWSYGIAGNFTTPLTRLDAIYFSVGTLSTAGTGNISAVSQVARGLQTLQMILDIGFVVLAVSLAVAGISSRMHEKRE